MEGLCIAINNGPVEAFDDQQPEQAARGSVPPTGVSGSTR
jgi:hypothetical protein